MPQIRGRMSSGQRWRMTVEKRRYDLFHKLDIIKALAELVEAKVDLKNPDKIPRVDIIGGHAGLSVLSPDEVSSTTKMPCFEQS